MVEKVCAGVALTSIVAWSLVGILACIRGGFRNAVRAGVLLSGWSVLASRFVFCAAHCVQWWFDRPLVYERPWHRSSVVVNTGYHVDGTMVVG